MCREDAVQKTVYIVLPVKFYKISDRLNCFVNKRKHNCLQNMK